MKIWSTQLVLRGDESDCRVEALLCEQPWWCHLLALAFHRFVCLHSDKMWIDVACDELHGWHRDELDLVDVTDSPAFTAPDSLC